MSTILKALKKLEQDKESFQAGGLPSDYMGPGSSHLHARQGIRRFFTPMLRRILILLLVLGLGGTAFYFYRQSRMIDKPSQPLVAKKEPTVESTAPVVAKAAKPIKSQVVESTPKPEAPAKSVKPSPPPEQSVPAEKPRTRLRTEPPSLKWQPLKDLTQPEKVKTITEQPTGDARPPATSVQPAPVRPVSPPDPKPAAPTTPPAQMMPPAPTKPPVQSTSPAPTKPSVTTTPAVPTSPPAPETPPAKTASPQEDPYKNTAALADGRLKVQAIAWSPVDEDRMAVINSRIVHEGDKVDGFIVTVIRHDDVVVSEQGTLYRVIFGKP